MSSFIPPHTLAISRPTTPGLIEKKSLFTPSQKALLITSVALGVLLFPKTGLPVKNYIGIYPFVGSIVVLLSTALFIATIACRGKRELPRPKTTRELRKERMEQELLRVQSEKLSRHTPPPILTDETSRYTKATRKEGLTVRFHSEAKDPKPPILKPHWILGRHYEKTPSSIIVIPQ